MARISTYANAGTPTLADQLIGTEKGASDATKNFTIDQLLTLFEDSTWGGLPSHADNAAAVAAAVAVGKLFVTTGAGAIAKGVVCRVY